MAKISGPLLNRIDIHIEVPRLSSEELMWKSAGGELTSSAETCCKSEREATEADRNVQRTHESEGAIEHYEMDSGTKDLLKIAIAQFNLFSRGYDRILKVSRTIAGLEGEERIEMHHVAEAINYRAFDRKLFG